MAICYLDGVTGDDANDGSSFVLAKKTYAAALTVVAGADPQIIVLVRGYFREGNFGAPNIQNGKFQHNICLGQVIFDGEGTKTKFSDYATQDGVIWTGAIFKDYTTDYFVWSNNLGGVGHMWFDCSFINNLGGSPDVYSYPWTLAKFYNCTFIDINFQSNITIMSSIMDANCTGGNPIVAYNASATASWRGTGGWDIATYPPPFTDAGNGDYSFDSGHAQFTRYRTLGMDGSQCGASFLGGVFYHEQGPGIGLDDHVLGTWANDQSYYDDSFDPVTVSSGVNDKIDFTDDDGTFAATVAAASYTDGATLATAIQTALNATASTQTYTCTFSSSLMRYTIANTTGALLSLLWNSGANKLITIGGDIGFDTTADDTGALNYQSDNAVTVDSLNGYTRVVVVGSTFEMDMGLEPAATSARVLGPVSDYGRAIVPKGLFWAAAESSTDVVDNSQATSTREIEVRGHSAVFNNTDAGGTTDIDWTMVARGTNMSFLAKQWWNMRAVLRNNGTP